MARTWQRPPDYDEEHIPKCGTKWKDFYDVEWEIRNGAYYDPVNNLTAGKTSYTTAEGQVVQCDPSHKFWWNRICHDDILGNVRRPPPPPLKGAAAKRPADGQPSDCQPTSRPALATASTPVPTGRDLTAQHVVNELAAFKSHIQATHDRLALIESHWAMYMRALFEQKPPVPPRPSTTVIEEESQGLE